MLSEFFHWWASQILDVLPSRLTRQDDMTADATILRVVTQDAEVLVELVRRVRRAETSLGVFSLAPTGMPALRAAASGPRMPKIVLLQLPPSLLLERDVTLPLAAEADLDRVLGYEMDRITPFSADSLFWAWQLIRRDRERATLQVRLSLLPKAPLEPWLAVLHEAGMEPVMLMAPGADRTPRHIPLTRKLAPAGGRVALRATAAVCAVLAVAVITTPLALNARAIATAEARIERLKPRVAQVDALRKRIAADTGGADVFAADAARVGNVLQALAALTEILPDDTWLTALSLRQRQLTFTGQSARAARLIGLLAAEPTLRNPAFLTPVTRADSSGSDLFSIRAELGL